MKIRFSALLFTFILFLGIFTACQKQSGSLTGDVIPNNPIEDPSVPNPPSPGTQDPQTPTPDNQIPDPPTPDNNNKPDPNAGIKLGKSELTLFPNNSILLEVSFTPAFPEDDKTITFAVSDPTVLTIDQSCMITALKAGYAEITVTCASYSAICKVTVAREKNANPGITLAANTIKLSKNKTAKIEATFVPYYKDESTKLFYISNNPQIVTVDENGNMKALASGSTSITIRDESGIYQRLLSVQVPAGFTLLAAGDNLLHSGIYNDARERMGGNGYDFLSIYNGIAEKVANSDFAMINQETVFTGESPTSYPKLNAPQEAVKALADLGFDIISLANNHCLDKGTDGLQKSMAYLDTLKDVIRLGAYYKANNDALKIRVIEKEGIKVALLAYTTFTNELPSNFNSSGLFVPWVADDAIIGDLERAKTKADAILVFMHWGDEESFSVTDRQKQIAKLLADNGADIIIGAHPHVIQGVEYIKANNGSSVPCVYSLGTLVSNMATEQNMLSCLLTFDFVKDPQSGEITIENLLLDPYVFYYNMDYRQSALYRITDLTEELAKSHGIGNYPKNSDIKNTLSVSRLYGYLKDNIDLQYLPEDIQTIIQNQ